MVQIREIQEDDAESFLRLCQKLDEKTQFMMLEPGEGLTTSAEQQERIKHLLLQDNQIILVAESNNRLAGFLMTMDGEYRRNRHAVHVVIGILQEYPSQGIGTRFFTEIDGWAKRQSIHRLELTVMTQNTKVLGLYKKMGFEIEGTKKDSLVVNGKYVNEYYMARLLS